MSTKDKLLERLRTRPSDFTFDELATLLRQLGYTLLAGGKMGCSRVAFANVNGDYIRLHKPHPKNIFKRYQIDEIIEALMERGLI
ncbi:MAG: type II toxin-antitoxin system HicA family toxin [Christensenellaceae bacterium]|nr:type II toxin-antitoxin system HicA family toxin [Christensenellaceae bacterium]